MRVIKWLDEHTEEVLLVVFTSIMVFIIALQVFMRFVIGSSLAWSEELARFSFIWLVYIGISYGVKKQRHIKVDVVLIALKGKAKIILNMISNVIFLGFAVVIIYFGQEIALRILELGQRSPGLRIPMGLVYLATPVGMGLTIIRLIQQLIQQGRALSGKADFEVELEHEKALDNQSDLIEDNEKEDPISDR
ncbi:TRAP transporter small permease [Salipaludibacillus aurantiacus]|uniref:TRAP-type C4-dicarboxylate transport system, small permease component n=1 Tax=Salipaludibacillus aurantiacus TaxID=1601833 RepID=A0A1H9UAM3_9BACI|nr:TRAP transporter small permease [Salipaludibacillus aurantiacus]SES06515.1 TRAP-type C4-dicarboxylate transport system, small permease component [Salipaludibacillus aurantiacus]